MDGSGAPARPADVAVEGDRIVAVGPRLDGAAARTIDASGHVVAPGFIDMHSHSDLFYFGCPSAESKVRQGVTTEVVGMCSFSQAPMRAEQREIVRGWAGGIGASLDLKAESFAQYLDALRSVRPSVNIAHFVGHGALRIAGMGFEARPAGADDLKAMQRLLAEAMDAGAFGFSTGLVYAPSAYSDTAELIALAKSIASRGGYYFSHIRGESSMLLDSINEAIRIGEEGGVSVQVSHVKASGRENWPKIDAALRLLETARARGVDVSGDVYPYNAGSTKLDNMIPAWAHDGGTAKLLERLADRATRRRIVEECLIDGERWGTVSQGGIGFDQVFIATCRRHELEGLSLAQIAREQKLFPLETAVHKMTGMCAARLRLRDRGLVREGYAADLAIFDPRTVKDESTFADPHRYPTGIPYVVVNGAVVVDGGRMRALGTGRVLTP